MLVYEGVITKLYLGLVINKMRYVVGLYVRVGPVDLPEQKCTGPKDKNGSV